MYRFCITERDIAPKYVFEFDAADQQGFISGVATALGHLRLAQPERHRAHGVYLFAGTRHGWTHVRNNSMRVIGLHEKLIFARPADLWHWAYKTAWGANHMDAQLGQLVAFLQSTPEERRERRRNKLTLLHGGRDG